jgi:hypothetical protein
VGRAVRRREGPLIEPSAGTQPWQRERVLMPHTCRSQGRSGPAQGAPSGRLVTPGKPARVPEPKSPLHGVGTDQTSTLSQRLSPGTLRIPITFAGDAPEAANPIDTTILVVEPDILVRTIIAEYLRNCGYKVLEGATAQDVITVLGSVASAARLLAMREPRRRYGGYRKRR